MTKFNSAGVLQFNTFLGGTGDDDGNGIAIDSSGQIYIVGSTTSSSWGSGAFTGARTSLSTTQDSFLVKRNAAGSSVLYSTYGLEGNNDDAYFSVAVDNSGHAYVAGRTGTSTTSGAVVAEYNTTTTGSGSLMHSTTWSGSDGTTSTNAAFGITIDGSGNVYVDGDIHANSGYTTANAYQSTYGGSNDGFVAELNSSFTTTYFTYLGGSGADRLRDIQLDSTGKVIVVGYTKSSGIKPPAAL